MSQTWKCAFKGVFSKSLDSSPEVSKISLSEVLGWVSDISVEGLSDGIGNSF